MTVLPNTNGNLSVFVRRPHRADCLLTVLAWAWTEDMRPTPVTPGGLPPDAVVLLLRDTSHNVMWTDWLTGRVWDNLDVACAEYKTKAARSRKT